MNERTDSQKSNRCIGTDVREKKMGQTNGRTDGQTTDGCLTLTSVNAAA